MKKNSIFNNRLLYIILTAFVVACPIIAKAIFGGQYVVMIMCICLIYIIAVTGLDILFGYSGQISLGHAAFFTIGAYTTALLQYYFYLPPYLTIPCGAILPALLGALIAWPASKLKFHFLSLSTVALGEITYYFLLNSPGGFTLDFRGVYVNQISFLGLNYTRWYFFLLIIVVVALVAKNRIINSRIGRSFIAVRENTHAADGMGIDVRKSKIMAFAISAFYTGFAGAIYVHFILYVSPLTSQQTQSVLFLTMLLFGGQASTLGTIIGVVSLETLLESVRFLSEYQMLLYAIIILIVIVGLPGGINGYLKKILLVFQHKNSSNDNGFSKIEAPENLDKIKGGNDNVGGK